MASIRVRLLVICMMVGFGGALPLSATPKLKVGLVLDKGGKDDKSFNTAAFLGMEKASKELSVDTKYVESTDDNAFEPLLRSFAKKDYDLIIAIGFSQAEAVKKIAAQFPQKKFAIVDAEVKLPNVRSLMFEEHQGSYLAGALAALTSKSGKVGFIGGMDIPLIRRFLLGYEAGAKAINPRVDLRAHSTRQLPSNRASPWRPAFGTQDRFISSRPLYKAEFRLLRCGSLFPLI